MAGLAVSFAGSVAGLIGRPLGPHEAFAVAVSGGPDSLALLLLAHEAFGGRVRALTVDHGLRADAAVEAAAVAALCAARSIPHATLPWPGAKPAANLQAAARAARYSLMAGWCAAAGVAWLATGHHADDQAETLLLRLARGSGLAGLTGIRPRRSLGHGVTLLRPLLGARHADLVALAVAAGLDPVDDPANRSPAFDRTRARALLAATPWLDPARLADVADRLAAAAAALDWVADLAWTSRVVADGATLAVDAADLPRDVRHRLVVRALAELAPETVPRGPAIGRLIARLDRGRPGTLAGIAVLPGPVWRFAAAPARTPRANDRALTAI
ncbi:MAG: tRNA lysidine(34) synthetase TilS [Janthinobacterium lividum]